MLVYSDFFLYDFLNGLIGILGFICLLGFALSILYIVALWKIFEKAGEPGWACLVPLYNVYVLFKIAFGCGWCFLLLFLPFINVGIAILLPFKLAKAFGKDIGWGFGLLFLRAIFILLLAFGDAVYYDPKKFQNFERHQM